MIQSFCGYAGLINFLFCLFFSFFIFLKNPNSNINKTFAFWSLNVALWSFGYFIWLFTLQPNTALFWTRFLMGGAILIPASFLHFTCTYLRIEKQSKHKFLIRMLYLFALLYLLLDFTPLFIEKVEPRYWFRWWPVPGSLYHIYQIYFIGAVIYAHYLFFQAAFYAKGLERKQLMFVAIGTAIAFTGGSTNFFIWYNIPIPPVLNFLVIGYVALISYAILNYRLWDIEVVIKRTIVFTGVSFTIFALFATTSFLITGILQQAMSSFDRLWLFAIVGMVSTAIIKPLDNYLVNITDKFLFQKKSNYAKVLKETSKDIAIVTSLNELTRKMVAVLIRKARTKNVAIYVRSENESYLELKGCYGYGGKDQRPEISIDTENPLIAVLVQVQSPLTKLMVEEEIRSTSNITRRETFTNILEHFKTLKAEVMVPSFLGGPNDKVKTAHNFLKLQSVLVLGGKKSDEDYYEADLDMLAALAQEHAITFENVRLFDVVLKEREARLQAQSEAKMGAFAKSIAHEIKNALAGLYGPAQFMTLYGYEDLRKKIFEPYLIGKLPSNTEKKFLDTLERMKQEGNKIMSKADEIRTIALTVQGTLSSDDAEFGEFDFKVVWDAAAVSAKPGHYKLTRNVPERIRPFGNVVLIQRVLVNLINNAAEAMQGQKNAEIVFRGSYQEIDDKKVAYFEFSDNGPGMPIEISERIFEQGFSTKPKPKSTDIEASGHGQGLWVCKEIVEQIHKGKIWVEAESGKGTIFKFWLPLAEK